MSSTLYNADGSRTGLRINAKVRRAHAFSRGSGPLSARRPMTEEENVVAEKQRAQRDFAAMTSAPAKVAPPPDKPKGQLVQGPGGSAVWRTNAQLETDHQMQESRAAARRKGVNMKPTPPPAGFTFPKLEGNRPRTARFERFSI